MPDVREIDGKYITRQKELTHLPVSYIQGCLVKRSYNVFLQETALFPYFQTQQLILLSISIAKNIRWEKTSLFFPAACVEEPPWHAAPIQRSLLLCPVLKRQIKWSANAIRLGLGKAGWRVRERQESGLLSPLPAQTRRNAVPGNGARPAYEHHGRQLWRPPPSLRFGQFLLFLK